MTIKAIETHYKGYRFRSRLEARWAVFFDALEIQWDYEAEGYDLGSIGLYLPDFWMSKIEMWTEIKRAAPTRDEILKAEYLAIDTQYAAMILCGTPMDEAVMIFDPKRRNWFNSDFMKDICIWCHLAGLGEAHDALPGFCGLIRHAYNAARSARFEHGETPKVPRGRPRK